MKKRIIGLLLACCLVAGLLPAVSFGAAAEEALPTESQDGSILYGEHTYRFEDGVPVVDGEPIGSEYGEIEKIVLSDGAVYVTTSDSEEWILLDDSLRGEDDMPLLGASTNEQTIYDFCINSLGVNVAAACGILSNIQSESSFNPNASVLDTNNKTSYGICQWNGDRFTALQNYCSGRGLNYTTLSAQLQYLQYELNGSENSAFNKVKNVENSADGAYEAGYNWARYFERCASQYYEGRAVRARDVYWAKYGGTRYTETQEPSSNENHYPACASYFDSIVDALNSIGVDSSFANRTRIAAANDINNYTGSADQNNYMLNLLKQGNLKNPDYSPNPKEEGSTSGYGSLLLNINWDHIIQVGHQVSNGQACTCYAYAYCKTILDKKVHYYSEFNQGTNEYDAWAPWTDGATYTGFFPSSKSDAFKKMFSELNAKKPVAVKVAGTRSGHHYVAVVGYENVSSENSLSASNFLIIDPCASQFKTENMAAVGYDLKAEDGVYQVTYSTTGKTAEIINNLPSGSEMTSGYNRTIPDGDYIIVNAGATAYYLDIDGVEYPASNSTNVLLWGTLAENPDSCDTWTVTYSDGFYTITQNGTNMALDVSDGSIKAEANVQVYSSNFSAAQKWAISENGRNGYRIQAKCSSYSLDVTGGGVGAGINIQQYPNNDSDAQSWLFIPYNPEQPIKNGRYVLLNAADRTYEMGVKTVDGDNNVQLYNDTAMSVYNCFDIVSLYDGYYKLIHTASGGLLDVAGAVSTIGGNIHLYQDNSSVAQQWAISRHGDGFILTSRCNGMCVTINNTIADGANIIQYPNQGLPAQLWYFVPAEYNVTYNANNGTGAPAAQIKNYKENLVFSSGIPTRDNYTFLGWADTANATVPQYQPGGSYTADADLTLYAVWQQNQPVITTGATLTAASATAPAGSAVTVPITLKNNPGVIGFSFALDYDTARLQYLSASDGDFSGVASTISDNGGKLGFVFSSASKTNLTGETIAKLSFRALDGAEGEAALSFVIDEQFSDGFLAYDADRNQNIPVDFSTANGKITIGDSLPGDVDGNGKVDNEDLVLLTRYRARWNVDMNMDAADVDASGKVDNDDLILLTRYRARWNVSLLPGRVSAKRIVSAAPRYRMLAASSQRIALESSAQSAVPGEEFEVSVLLKNNPGIVGFSFAVKYDANKMELISKADGDFRGIADDISENGGVLGFAYASASTANLTGETVAKLRFRVKDGAAGAAELSILIDEDFGDGFIAYDAGSGKNVPVSFTPAGMSLAISGAAAKIISVTPALGGVTASVYCPETGATVYCAAYQSDGRMLLVNSMPAKSGLGSYDFPSEGSYVKVFVLDQKLSPLCESQRLNAA